MSKKKKHKKKNPKTQENNDGHVKITRMEAEIAKNPQNVYTAQRLAAMKKQHHGKTMIKE